VARPEHVDVWIGLDAGKEDHFAEVLDLAADHTRLANRLRDSLTSVSPDDPAEAA
jgi:hypothetical protein